MGNSTSANRNEQATTNTTTTNNNSTTTNSGSTIAYKLKHKGSAKRHLNTQEEKSLQTDRQPQQQNGAQRVRQASTWSFGSLSGRLNWSFTGAASRGSFHNRNKSTRKTLTCLQQRRSKTQWHKPLTNAIFNSHFKEASRNDQFHIAQLVAKGAFGVVFKVINKHYTQELEKAQKNKSIVHPAPVYALKVLKKSKIIEENSLQQIKDEADIQKLCGHHSFIVQQVDSWQNRRNLHILSEYVPNGELFSKISQFSLDLTRVYLAEIALATDFLHNAGVIYRDIKPENILLTANFHIKLTDFGLSKWLRLGATTRTMCGTLQYMAPEILRREPYGHAVDWWSMGILVCQMLTQMSPDISQFINVVLLNQDHVDRAGPLLHTTHSIDMNSATDNFLQAERKSDTFESQNFLPSEVENLPHEAKDVLKRLLEVDPKQRLRSVLSLQKIALYKNFKIDSKFLLNLRPIDMIDENELLLFEDHTKVNNDNNAATKAFQDF